MLSRIPWRNTIWIIAGAAILLGNKGFRRLVHNAIELHRLRKEYSSLLQEQATLEDQLQKARTSDFAIEAAARHDLGFIKPGELEYRFPPPQKQ